MPSTATLIAYLYPHENTKSRVYFSKIVEIFSSTYRSAQNQPKSQIQFHKNCSPLNLYTMTLTQAVFPFLTFYFPHGQLFPGTALCRVARP